MAQTQKTGGYERGAAAAEKTLLTEITRTPKQLLIRQVLVRIP